MVRPWQAVGGWLPTAAGQKRRHYTAPPPQSSTPWPWRPAHAAEGAVGVYIFLKSPTTLPTRRKLESPETGIGS
jgi:hypothetical protein